MAHVPRGRHFEELTPGETFTTAVAVRNQRGETVCEFEWTTLMARRT